jgi:hypothetical protein
VWFVDQPPRWLTEKELAETRAKWGDSPPPRLIVPRSESAAIRTLKQLASAQQSFRKARYVDQDGDGVAEYGFLRELAGRSPFRRARRPSSLREVPFYTSGPINTNGELLQGGYVYHMFLPSDDKAGNDATPEPAKIPGLKSRDADAQEERWCCYAWPAKLGETGNRAFVINQQGMVYETDNTVQKYDGPGHGPRTGNEAFAKGTRNLKGKLASTDKGEKANDGGNWQPAK